MDKKNIITSAVLLIYVVNVETLDLQVDTCTKLETHLTVTDGVAGGKVFIQGTTSSDTACSPQLTGAASESFDFTFTTCGVLYSETQSSNSIDFYVTVTQYELANIKTDPMYHVMCTFSETNTVVALQLTSQISDKSGILKEYETDPKARLTLYHIDDVDSNLVTEISYDTTVVMGDILQVRIDLDIDIPDYTLLVEECFLEVKAKDTSLTISSLDLLDTSTHCALYDIFPDFANDVESVNSTAGNVFDAPYAWMQFEAFIPLSMSVQLALVDVNLIIGCKVAVCFNNNSDCAQPTCSNRQKRQESVSNPDTTRTWLYEGFNMEFGNRNGTTDPTVPGIIPVEPGTNDICLDKHQLWGILFSLLLLVLGAFIATCWVLVCSRRNRRRKEKELVYVEKDPITANTITTSVAHSESPTCDSPVRYLPRLVPLSPSRGSHDIHSASA